MFTQHAEFLLLWKIVYSQDFVVIEPICLPPILLIFSFHGALENTRLRKGPDACHSCSLTDAENLAFTENETLARFVCPSPIPFV